MRKILYPLAGLMLVYLVSAFLAAELNPTNWGWGWRLWTVAWAIPWTLFPFLFGADADAHAAWEKRKTIPRPSTRVIDQ